ncbi:hypothetical protein [Aurantimonas sp. A3-2-R12]|uniref:hypothetical protein n=1 Tax=Aurantimonas sp. A3-2-R12 TaxID=3114362 RepID=UPI002E16D2D9|nr:hypothetical protein [Aurantimonas sp. A3-2-R12]
MSELPSWLVKTQPIPLLLGLAAMWWVAPTTAAGKAFVVITVVLACNAVIQLYRWWRPSPKEVKPTDQDTAAP